MFKTLILVFAIIAAAFAGLAPVERQERAAVYSAYNALPYSAYPVAYSSYGSYPTAYSSVYSPYAYGGYYGAPAVRYV